MKNKKIFIIGGVILAIIIIFSIFYFSCKSKINNNILIINSVNNDRIFFPKYYNDNYYYLGGQGIMWYKYNLNNAKRNQIFENEILAIDKINYSSNAENAIVYSYYPQNNIKNYNLVNKKIFEIDSNIQQVVWQNNKILYSYYKKQIEKTEQVLNIAQANQDGTGWKIIKDFSKSNYVGLNLYAKDNDTYFYQSMPYEENQGSTLYKSYVVNPDKEERITPDKSVYSKIVFTKDFHQIAYLNSEKKLILQNLEKIEDLVNTKVEVNNVNQIIFSQDTKFIYYLIDLNNLVKINIGNLKQTNYSLDNSAIDYTNMLDDNISNLVVSSDGLVLYFTYNNYLYSIDLK